MYCQTPRHFLIYRRRDESVIDILSPHHALLYDWTVLMIPETIAHYRITGKLGQGGMGEVYRATDTKLGRQVAIKVLPDVFAADPDRMARFIHEAKILASLNHPSIACIYGIEERAIIMELVEGETLKGPLPLDTVLNYAIQITAALEYAHEKGVVHGDLMPANVMVTPSGGIKVLDFGLAKITENTAAPADETQSPTLTLRATQAGVILGTAAYMSPEQARGKPQDKRTDLWAFGCVLFELITGSRAFTGDNSLDVLASVVGADPEWSKLPADTPSGIRRLLRRCLEKDPTRRLHDAGDARLELLDDARDDARKEPVPIPPAPTPIRSGKPWVWILSALCAGAAIAGALAWQLRPIEVAAPVTRFSIPLVAAQNLNQPIAITPDGTRLAYLAGGEFSAVIHIRDLSQNQTRSLPGTDGAMTPGFSPDGEWIVFSADGKLKKVQASGGSVGALTTGTRVVGGGVHWTPDGEILFCANGLASIPAMGGATKLLTTPPPGEEHFQPELLPGGKAILFTILRLGEQTRVAVLQRKTGAVKILIEGAQQAHYLNSGHLVYYRGGKLERVAFDPEKLSVSGAPVPVAGGVSFSPVYSSAAFAASPTGVLVYRPGSGAPAVTELTWADRAGQRLPLAKLAHPFNQIRLSPNGRTLILANRAMESNLWSYDLERGTLSRVTFEPGEDETPVWSPDGRQIAWATHRKGPPQVVVRNVDGTGGEQTLWSGTAHTHVDSWSPDGKFLALSMMEQGGTFEVMMVSLQGDRKPQPFLNGPYMEMQGVFSPDGRWIAYSSNESGQNEVYVSAWPGPGGKLQISAQGGLQPLWARGGRELCYRSGTKVMAVPIENGAVLRAGTPTPLFDGNYETEFAVASDGQRFVMIPQPEAADASEMLVTVNWLSELR
ncbi:MAG: protein kinase [Acidobacteriia bacterium]|nr:protein kinase [Terriglobia bacterium]